MVGSMRSCFSLCWRWGIFSSCPTLTDNCLGFSGYSLLTMPCTSALAFGWPGQAGIRRERPSFTLEHLGLCTAWTASLASYLGKATWMAGFLSLALPRSVG